MRPKMELSGGLGEVFLATSFWVAFVLISVVCSKVET